MEAEMPGGWGKQLTAFQHLLIVKVRPALGWYATMCIALLNPSCLGVDPQTQHAAMMLCQRGRQVASLGGAVAGLQDGLHGGSAGRQARLA